MIQTVGMFAAEALVKIGSDAVPEVTRALASENLSLRREAAEVLGKIGKPAKQALPRLKVLAGTEKDESDRLVALQACFEIQNDPEEVLDLLMNRLADESPQVRGLSAQLLGRLGGKARQAVPALIRALKDDSQRYEALTPDFIDQVPVRGDVVAALGAIGPAAKSASNQLSKIMREDADVRLRPIAALALWRIGEQRDAAMQALLSQLEGVDHDEHYPAAAAEALGEIGPAARPALPKLAKLLTSRDELVRVSLMRSVGKIGGDGAIVLLRKGLKDPDEFVRESAAEALGELAASAVPAIPDLIEALRDAEDDDLGYSRRAAADALGKIGPAAKESLTRLEQIVHEQEGEDGDENLREAAKAAIQRIRGKR